MADNSHQSDNLHPSRTPAGAAEQERRGDVQDARTPPPGFRYRRRMWWSAAVVVFVFVALFMAWQWIHVLALTLLGLLLGIFFHTGALWINRLTKLPYGAALFVFCTLLVAGLALLVWQGGSAVSAQVDQLAERIPQSLEQLRTYLSQTRWGQFLLNYVPMGQVEQALGNPQELLSRVDGLLRPAVMGLVSMMVAAVFILFVGLYLAVEPRLYRNGVLWLMPVRWRPRGDAVLISLGHTMRHWLYARLASMAIVGVLSGIGLYILGIPLALTLGVLTGLLAFIPNFGPVASVVPPALLAMTTENGMFPPGQLVLAVIILYVGIQALESYLITPLIMKRAVEIPPALLITVQLALGALLGIVGVLLADPLTAAGMTIVRKLWVEGDVDHEDPRQTPAPPRDEKAPDTAADTAGPRDGRYS